MIEFRRFAQTELPDVRQVILDTYAEVYEGTDAFHATARFDDRLTSHSAAPGWEVLIGYDAGEPVGFTYAAPLRPQAKWWTVMREPLPAEYIEETGSRTLALFELMIREQWRGTGEAKRIHDALLDGRREERVVLLVDPEHPKVKALYEEWGYEHIGDQQPFSDSPVYAVMMKDPLR
ncbi:GNAT family N-acetyltransferase [Streptomyces sp. NPDC001922]|uniref:GNAT family N-acetyltransferase n=1 Tax=Streptomyces sp. NPDC001922 TaxID=3364624 RepID=UPI00369DD53A